MKITLGGEFNESDIKEIAETLRRIERSKPNLLFTLNIEAPEKTIEECRRLISRIWPPKVVMPKITDSLSPEEVEIMEIEGTRRRCLGPGCSVKFIPFSDKQIYCSNACKNRAQEVIG